MQPQQGYPSSSSPRVGWNTGEARPTIIQPSVYNNNSRGTATGPTIIQPSGAVRPTIIQPSVYNNNSRGTATGPTIIQPTVAARPTIIQPTVYNNNSRGTATVPTIIQPSVYNNNSRGAVRPTIIQPSVYNNNSTGAATGPTIIQPSVYNNRQAMGGSGGIGCCGCVCCSCLHLSFLRTRPGWLKVIEMVLSSICLSLTLEFGLPYSSTIGSAFTFFLVTVCACILVVCLLTFSYLISYNSFNLIRSSVLETVFNTLACLLYLASSSQLSWAVHTWLWPNYLFKPQYSVYPAMSAAYVLGLVLGVVHGVDAWMSYRFLTGKST
ncbi:hypothetical protein Pmani_027516 [Petrolisthes manimaculis]|uniref:MARVEL domain-containing protein n=1 Tax=Petrolisthes manimaculis TaxID=1843537 RepID=A0AAE1TWF4_9EUCA|nr:hypothetical protein Pmani_027516 [Petrolisthes manimaculis]